MASKTKKGEQVTSITREISNNILVLILIIIIFVSILGTLIVQQALQELRPTKEFNRASDGHVVAAGTGMVALTVLPSKEQAGEKE